MDTARPLACSPPLTPRSVKDSGFHTLSHSLQRCSRRISLPFGEPQALHSDCTPLTHLWVQICKHTPGSFTTKTARATLPALSSFWLFSAPSQTTLQALHWCMCCSGAQPHPGASCSLLPTGASTSLQERRDIAGAQGHRQLRQQGHRVLGHTCRLASRGAPAHIPVMTPIPLPLPIDAGGS